MPAPETKRPIVEQTTDPQSDLPPWEPSDVAGLEARSVAVVQALDEARARTYALVASLSDADYRGIHHPCLGPIAWDVGHMGQQEDLWLVQTLGGRPETAPDTNRIYDAYRNQRSMRHTLPLSSHQEVHAYHRAVRKATLEVLRTGQHKADDATDPLWHDLWIHRFVVQHEHQHDETILQHLQCLPEGHYTAPLRRVRPRATMNGPTTAGFALHPGGRFTMGVPRHTPWTYDNEWDPHTVDLPGFWLQRSPVTNAQFLAFIDDDGYTEPDLWHPDGLAHIVNEGIRAPLHWSPDDARPGAWNVRETDRLVPMDPAAPVANVSWYEADAFARWAGARLPTEAEWEYAATWDPTEQAKRLWPWGDAAPDTDRANLDHTRYGTDPIGSHPSGVSVHGVHQLVGDVWEWTCTEFGPYPGFEAFPYRDYSERFFDTGLMVLRGGSWATRPSLRLGTFRNWDLPQRRQVFAGLRLAADAPDGHGRPPRLRIDEADTGTQRGSEADHR